ncbi:xin actin-binding repeat-containing protein 2-like isoform X2 [Brienomyrus brachyistius]|uniref:xin actin-binding repeat-containing protein 2-like isoform X2 n=1 Tax=Brienomyrus brachyistius TaxID=42636 RepID=UPI0020B19AE3|nr:xin actin-binding repeat-containing protein 2-like isoform X2 [Brienomyrus brachyistius]
MSTLLSGWQRGDIVSATMEIQSGNRPPVLSGTGSTTSTSLSSFRPQAAKATSEAARELQKTAKKFEKFDISLENLRMMFEKPRAEVKPHQVAHPSPSRQAWVGQSNRLFKPPKDLLSSAERMSSKQTPDLDQSACGAGGSGAGAPEKGVSGRSGAQAGAAESIPLRERLAMYQAAVSKSDVAGSSSSGAVMEEAEACSLPGGLASVKKQFESQEISSSQSTVTQYHFQHRSVQEVSSTSEVTVKGSSRESLSSGQMVPPVQDEKFHYDQSAHQSNVVSSYENHFDGKVKVVGGEDIPKISTQVLKQQFEKHIEDATPSKQIKIDLDFNQFQWAPSHSVSSKVSSSKTCETSSMTRKVEEAVAASSSACASVTSYESMEHLPPPPPDLLLVPLESQGQDSEQELFEQLCQARQSVNKEQYSKQRNLYELKRLYKHIHPEVRKNLERDFFSDVTEIEKTQLERGDEVTGDVQQARYVFENSESSPIKSVSPEREYLEWDEILKGEVQSMRWMFENKPLDSIKDDTPDEDSKKSIAQQEIIAGSDVKYTTWMFETQPIDALGTDTPDSTEQASKLTELARGDVRTATWLFETQPLDALSKIYQEEDQSTEVICTKDITGGDVKTARYLFETQLLDSLGHTETIDESHFLQLKSELEEIKGDVKTSTKLFETEPLCVIRGDSGQMLEITKVRREETEKGDVKTSRWLFETQPLDMINKDPAQVKLICGVSIEDNSQGGVNRGRWLFETKTLDSIKDEDWESSKLEKEKIIGADVRKHCWTFETQPMDSLKDTANARPMSVEEVVGGDVQTARHLFETVPMDALKDSPEVGKLKKVVTSEEEKGDVRHQKWVFESQPLENIREEKKESIRTVNLQELDRGDVSNCKVIFETMDLGKCDDTQKIQVEGVTSGSVKSNKVRFESTPLYAMQDSYGAYHEVRTVRREEIVKGDVRTCKWMFETRPIDQFDESISKLQIIKGISKQETESGDVKTAKWLFETQPLDSIKYFSNVEDEATETTKSTETVKGDVKTCRWLFETQPMDALYEKAEVKGDTETEAIHKGDVKTCTWLFETQSLDTIRDESETILRTCTVDQEDIHGKDVRMARFLFETENLENIRGDDTSAFKRVTEIDIQSGDVSRMKYIFENQSSDIMTSTSKETLKKLKTIQAEDIQKGNVVNCTWLFENQPIDAINEGSEEHTENRIVTDIQGGDVNKGRFIFETFSLDKIHAESSDTEISKMEKIICDETEKGDVKNYTMMFETQPLYAIRDKEGHYHEVTTVTKEEMMKGDVVGARWLFETKPLDSIRDTDEVYVIKSVTQEDIQKGDVNSARWRFETQSLDKISEEAKLLVRTVDDVQGGDVQTNKQRFESEDLSQKYIRTVSVSEIHKGDVRTATWMFETRTIDEIHGEASEYEEMKKVTKEEVLKGDVKQSVWLFEKQPLDKIKEVDESNVAVSREEIPQADVKTTTWLFETTPFHEFNESSMQKTEIIGKSIQDTLKELYSQKIVKSQGILIETDEIGDVRMAKYNLMNQEAPEIQKEDIIRGDLKNIMMNLLNRRETTEKTVVIDKEERGDINTIVQQLFNQDTGINVEREEIIRGDIQEAISNLMKEDESAKRGILIQEDEKGDVRMTIYSLLNKQETSVGKEDIIKGNVRGAINILLSNPNNPEQYMKIKVGDTEKGNVNFYSTCIESGALDYLKELQSEPDERGKMEKEKIVGGDVEGTKLILEQNQSQVERTVAEDDIVPGDVHNTVKVFMTEPVISLDNIQKEVIVKGDLRAVLDSLTQAVNQKMVVEKEEVVKGDINSTLRSLEEAQYQLKEIEKAEIVPGDIKGTLQSLEKSASSKVEIVIEDLVPGDIKGTLKSLEDAKQAVKEVEKEEIVKGDIQMAMQSLRDASNEKKVYQQQVSVQGDVKGTIQLLLEPPAPCKTQCKASTEGDVKMSIKSLYDMQEQSQMEKEEAIKGDVQGTIKGLLKGKQQKYLSSSIDGTKEASVSMKTSLPPQQEAHKYSVATKLESKTVKVKNLCQANELRSSSNKHAGIKSAQGQSLTKEDNALISQTTVMDMSPTPEERNIKEPSLKPKVAVPGPGIIKKKNVTDQVTNNMVTNVNQCVSQSNVATKHSKGVKTVVLDTDDSRTSSTSGMTHLNTVKNESQTKTTTKPVQGVKISSHVTGNTSQANMTKAVSTGNQLTQEAIATGATNVIKNTSQGTTDARHLQDTKTTTQVQTKAAEHKTIVQKHDIKTLKTEFRNLDMNRKGFVKPIKKGKEDIHMPPPPLPTPPLSESEFPLPPPPPPVLESEGNMFSIPLSSVSKQDSDLPPPPPPPPVDLDHFPPPPPPPPPHIAGQDYLPPPPSQQELDSMPGKSLRSPLTKAQQMPVKPIKAPSLYKIPKPEAHKQFGQGPINVEKNQVTPPPPSTKIFQVPAQQTIIAPDLSTSSQNIKEIRKQEEAIKIAPTDSLRTASQEEDSPGPVKKVYKPQIKLPPPPVEPVPARPKTCVRKFKTPLMIAEEKYRKQREESEKTRVGTAPASPASDGDVQPFIQAASEASATDNTAKGEAVSTDTTKKEAEAIIDKIISDTVSLGALVQAPSRGLSVQPLIPSRGQPSARKIASAVDKELQNVVKESNISKQTVVQDFTNLQMRTSTSLKTDEMKQTDVSLNREVSKVPLQPTKIPKVTPNFKVKTVKIPKIDKMENLETEKKESSAEATNKQQLSKQDRKAFSQMTREITKVTESCVQESTEIVNEAEKHVEKAAAVKDSKLETQMLKPKQKFKEKTVVIPKEKMSCMKGNQEKEVRKMQKAKAQHGGHDQVSEEVIITESNVQQSFQQQSTVQVEKQMETSQMQKDVTSKPQIQDKPQIESRHIGVKLTGKTSQKGESTSSVANQQASQKCEEIHRLLSQIDVLLEPSGKIDSKAVRTLLIKIPSWLIDPAAKRSLEVRPDDNIEKLKDILVYVRSAAQMKVLNLGGSIAATEKPGSGLASEKIGVGGAISKISIGSSKVEAHNKVLGEGRTSHESMKQKFIDTKKADSRGTSPLIRMRSPSPTYITIESTRRASSPQRVGPSPPPMHRSCTPPEPPPRMFDPTTSQINRASPSPTFSRSDKLAKLKDTTAKLSQGASPPPLSQHAQIAEKKSEIVESPSSFHRQIKIETHVVETSEVSEATLETASVKDKKEFFEEAQKAEVNRMYVRKDPIEIPERLGPDTEETEAKEKGKEEVPWVNLSGLVHKFESPEQKVYTRKEPILIAERLGSDTEDADPEDDQKGTQVEPVPTFNIKTIKTMFEMGEQSSSVKEQKHKHEKPESEMREIMTDGSKQTNPWRQQKGSWQTSPPPIQKEALQSGLTEPMGFSGSQSVSETFSSIDEFGNKISGSRCATTVSQHSEHITTRCAPPTYADVVKGKVQGLDVLTDSTPEELLKNFQKTWNESESVFKSLGYNVTEQKTSQTVSRQQETLMTENSSSRVGAVRGLPEEGVSNGVTGRRQTKLP